MSTEVITASPDDTLAAAANAMVTNDIGGLPVIDADGFVVGIVTEADFVEHEAKRDRPPSVLDLFFNRQRSADSLVRDVMTPFPALITADRLVVEAAEQLTRRGIKRLPVVDEERRLVGIVSRSDIVRYLADGHLPG
ncbi:MAG: CBS domain-containing protein [Acidimicrobiia bacterium]|nr:CBS domain-containing protein [Acidimicrobiia bacterium]NNF63905.1 CBS domain-containing protein [Acidimicrobiia bacterium]